MVCRDERWWPGLKPHHGRILIKCNRFGQGIGQAADQRGRLQQMAFIDRDAALIIVHPCGLPDCGTIKQAMRNAKRLGTGRHAFNLVDAERRCRRRDPTRMLQVAGKPALCHHIGQRIEALA